MSLDLSLDEYQKEVRYSIIFSTSVKWLGNFSLLAFVLVMVFMKDIHIKYSILTYYSILCRIAGMMIFKYYEIPTIVHEFARGNDDAYKIIEYNRDEILKRMFRSIYGLGYDRSLINLGKDELRIHIIELERKNWKRYGIYFSFFFFIMTGVTLWVLGLE